MIDKPQENNDKKTVLLRLSPTLWRQVQSWAEDDFRSLNGQIEYILTQAVNVKRNKKL